jgi:hypothetical protein
MPRRSGLFGYLKSSRESDKLNAITLKCANIRKIRYRDHAANFIVTLKAYEASNNPFIQQGFELDTSSGSEPHLRIDESYESSKSPISSRIYLSYCHGTETFSNGTNNTIVAHYYFDEWGQFQTLQCKKNGVVIELSSQQIRTLQDRAQQFQDVVENLLDLKAEEYKKMSEQLENEHDRIMKICLKGKVTHEQITKFTKDLQVLASEKDRLENNVTDARTKLFISMIQNLYNKKVESTATEALTPDIQATAPPKGAAASSNKSNPQKKTAPQLAAVELQNISKEFKDLETISKQLSTQMQNGSGTLDATQVQDYIERNSKFRDDLLTAIMHECLNPQQLKQLNDMWDKSQHFTTDMKLFEHAIKAGNLNLVELLFPYCSNRVSMKFYTDILFYAMNPKINIEKVFDFLSEACPVFNKTIHQQNRLFYKQDKTSPVAHSVLAHAYMADNKNLFAALLKYGVNPFQPWILAENMAYPALYAIGMHSINTDFYVNTLLAEGVTFSGNDPQPGLNSARSLRSIARTAAPAQRHSAARELQQLATFKEEFGEMHEEVPISPKYVRYNEQGLTHLIALLLNNKKYFECPKLFAAMVNNSDSSSVLAALSIIATNIYFNLIFLFTSKIPGFSMPDTDVELNYKRSTLHANSPTPSIHTWLLFPDNIIDENDRKLVQACTRMLIEKINSFSDDEAEITNMAIGLAKQIQLLSANKLYDSAAIHRVALVLLHSIKHTPSDSDRVECVKQLYGAAKDFLQHLEVEKDKLREAIQTHPRDPATQTKTSNFAKTQRFVYANVTRLYFDAITMACLGMPQVPGVMPEVLEAQTALKKILSELKAKEKPILAPDAISFYEQQLTDTYDRVIEQRSRSANNSATKTLKPGG